MGDNMLSKIDLRDFFEINQGLYNEPASPSQMALLQALASAMEQAAKSKGPHCQGLVHDRDAIH